MSAKEQALRLLEQKVARLVTKYRKAALADAASPSTFDVYRELHAAVRSMRRLRGPLPMED